VSQFASILLLVTALTLTLCAGVAASRINGDGPDIDIGAGDHLADAGITVPVGSARSRNIGELVRDVGSR
jgi:hypothetical protein